MSVDWHQAAACRGTPLRLWFPERGDALSGRIALSICARCPVRGECLAEAVALESECWTFGIRGGLTADQRRALSAR